MSDVRASIRSMVAAIDPGDQVETAHQLDVLAWMDSGVEVFRQSKPAIPPKHLVSYCVLVDSERQQVLLVDHRDAQLWLPTGGHVDPGELPAAAARREIEEELGLTPDFHAALGPVPLLVTVTQTGGMSLSHTDVSLWFVFETSISAELSPDAREFADVRWWDFDAVTEESPVSFDPHLPRFIRKLQAVASSNA